MTEQSKMTEMIRSITLAHDCIAKVVGLKAHVKRMKFESEITPGEYAEIQKQLQILEKSFRDIVLAREKKFEKAGGRFSTPIKGNQMYTR